MNPTLARVLKFHPQDMSCDIELASDGSRYDGTRVICGMVSSSSGRVDLHEPEGNVYGKPGSGTRDVIALVIFVDSTPLVIGFIADQVCQLMFERANFRVDRHASDVYETIDKNGNYEWAHPSGTFLRIAEDPDHEDLTGSDFDQKWAITRNTARAPWVSLLVANAGAEKLRLRIDPDGNVTMTHAGNLDVTTAGDTTVTAANVSVNAETATVTATITTVNGEFVVNGDTTLNGDIAITGASATMGGVNIGKTHTHQEHGTGGGTTGPPS